MTSAELDLFALLGRAIGVLTILYRLGRPSGESEIADILRITPLTARRYLNRLRDAGLVERGNYRYGYYINREGIRFLGEPANDPALFDSDEPVPAPSGNGNRSAKSADSAETADSAQTADASAKSADSAESSRLTVQNAELTVVEQDLTVGPESDPQPTVKSAPRTINSSQRTIKSAAQTVKSTRGLLSTYSSDDLLIKSSAEKERAGCADQIRIKHLQAIRESLQAAGLIWNRRTQKLARLQHVTPDYITAHYLLLKNRGLGNSGGLLVSILESGAPAPRLNTNRHLEGCRCHDCNHLAYASWNASRA